MLNDVKMIDDNLCFRQAELDRWAIRSAHIHTHGFDCVRIDFPVRAVLRPLLVCVRHSLQAPDELPSRRGSCHNGVLCDEQTRQYPENEGCAEAVVHPGSVLFARFLGGQRCGPTPAALATCATGWVQGCLPISSRKRTVVFLLQPHALSCSVKDFRQRRHRKRRFSKISSTCCPRREISRFFLGRVSWIFTHLF